MTVNVGLPVLYRTLSHIPFSQILALFRHRLKKVWNSLLSSSEASRISKQFSQEWPHTSRRFQKPESAHPLTSPDRTASIQSVWEDFSRGMITILNRQETFPPENFWAGLSHQNLPPLVVETLHYHQYLADFAELLITDPHQTGCGISASQQEVLETIHSLFQSWHRMFPIGSRSGWTAFASAQRVGAWLKVSQIISRIETKESQEFQVHLNEALFEQGLFIEQNLEWHLGGNHLLNNLCGLAQLVGFFQGTASDRWLKILKRHLPAQLKKQILPDGGHYERSPMYHSLVMSDLLSAAESLLLADAGWTEDHLKDPLNRMGAFLEAILHDDGDIPFFNDTVLGQTPSPDSLLQRLHDIFGTTSGTRAKDESPQVLDHSGFIRLKAQGLTVIIDQGRLGPDELMGHVHSDALSFEVSYQGQRVLVNRGVYEYTSGPRRQEARSIQSHNTPCVDGFEQAECWGSFRVGRRHHLDEHFFIATEDSWRGGGAWRLPCGVVIQRSIILTHQGKIEVWDSIQGKGLHSISIPFYWGPSLQVNLSPQSLSSREKGVRQSWELRGKDLTIYGKTFSNLACDLLVEPVRRWPGFYREENIERLVFRSDAAPLPLLVWTVFSPFPDQLSETDQQWERRGPALLQDPAHPLKASL